MVEEVNATQLTPLAEYIKHLMGSESIRSLAARADVSHGGLSEFLAGKAIPKADTLKKIGAALGADEARLMLLAGYLDEIPFARLHPRAATLAERITRLDDSLKFPILDAMESQLDTLLRITGAKEDAQQEPGVVEIQISEQDAAYLRELLTRETEGDDMGDKKEPTAPEKAAKAILEALRLRDAGKEKAEKRPTEFPSQSSQIAIPSTA